MQKEDAFERNPTRLAAAVGVSRQEWKWKSVKLVAKEEEEDRRP